MTRKLILVLFMGAALSANAQKTPETGKYKILPSDQWELGLSAGAVFTQADANNEVSPGLGVGLYVRKALDHVFSVRASVNYYTPNGKNNSAYNTFRVAGSDKMIDKFNSTIINGEIDAVLSLGSIRFESGKRTINPYFFLGGGYGKMNTSLTVKSGSTTTEIPDAQQAKFPGRTYGYWGQAQGGAGLGFRLSDKASLGIEYKVIVGLGSWDDFLDGVIRDQKDIPSYLNVRLGFNVGGGAKGTKSMPLWWANPAEQINANIADLTKRPVYDPTDTDADGVIDVVDQEKDTPAGARVDTRGIALDSDSDGLADYKDKEPFSPIGFQIDKTTGVAQVPKTVFVTETDVDRIVDAKLAKFQPIGTTSKVGGGMADWFLPMIHFDLDKANIKQTEYGNLSAVASVMKSNPGVNVVVSGHTDKLSSDGYNQGLSYRRANNAIDILVNRFGVERSRLVLNYGGENTTLVPTSGNSYMNRRVEFKVAKGETEMGAPATGMKKKSYKGNKSAGY
jgi:OmpA-OmpF porin, OOP family